MSFGLVAFQAAVLYVAAGTGVDALGVVTSKINGEIKKNLEV